eukprot:625125-Amphidinium_carterae.1
MGQRRDQRRPIRRSLKSATMPTFCPLPNGNRRDTSAKVSSTEPTGAGQETTQVGQRAQMSEPNA